MSIKRKIKNGFKYFFNKDYRFTKKAHWGKYDNWDDQKYLKRLFKAFMGYELNLENPKTFNEKLNWLKLYDRKPEYTIMVDKYLAKKYVADRIGEEYVVPLLGVWDNFDEINFDSLPSQFVLKTTHDCGGVVVCKNKKTFDKKKTKKCFEKHLKRNFYLGSREWPYKNIQPRIIAEKFMQDGDSKFLPVYKFFCFDGKPTIIQCIQNDKQKNESIDYFDTNWNVLELKQNFPNSINLIEKPKELEKMIEIASALSKDKQGFIRVDLYVVNSQIYFSEFTFFSDAGLIAFNPNEWDLKLGEMIKLPTKDKKNKN